MALTRRALLASGGAAGLAAAAAGAGFAAGQDHEDGSPPDADAHVVAFHGEHQAGIVTPAQDRLHFAAFDLEPDVTRTDLRDLLRAWTTAAATMAGGDAIGTGAAGAQLAPPDDTGEALDLTPARLTTTFGFGPTLFDERFGLAAHRPAALSRLPDLPGDALDRSRSDGDLCVQACADDPQVAFHAVRNLARIGRGVVTVRWSQLGFGRTSSTSRAQATPRNLMGFKDGTNNLKAEDARALAAHVWVGDAAAEPAWLRGGSYLVARRIRMLIEVWDRASLADQEQTMGRTKVAGAPLGGTDEFATLKPGTLPADSHVRLAHPSNNADARILRRGYSFTDGLDHELGQLDAGLFFLAYMRDPAAFITLQNHLGAHDALNEYIKHVGSGLWAIAPGVRRGGYVGDRLIDAV
ncbi:MAG TPA: iron uptake transporter deferrochelatase/peroxidase subunit [Baekduia sp.]|uniref:iron uptake transporter deferrochelatase/peroxidase subunit n=1 Tax=Baekduia sp. TaxID=2600305 RepID=UPI002CE78575|nr:iron uptake transporter deferrochelatase/peroxidase subunit [Baekduia sp.]HMJ36473.1 iron uptake transporter deferrochelatase/peroxidase subunit [Baekduia sp.]